MRTATFCFYGICIEVLAESLNVIQQLENDFVFFQKPTERIDFSFLIRSETKRPRHWLPFPRIGRSRFYLAPFGELRLCFFEKSWVSYRHHEGKCEIFSDPSTAYEVSLMMLLAYVGEALDRKGIHRIHGLAIAWQGAGAILLAPSGGGKSTLAMQLLSDSEIGLLSDDVPWVTSQREILAFPQRIALKSPPLLPPDQYWVFRRFRYGEKYVVKNSVFREKIAARAPLRWIIIMDSKRGTASLSQVPRWKLWIPLLRWLLVGHETPQIWEVFLRLSFRNWLSKVGIFLRRLWLVIKLTTQCRAANFRTSENAEESAECLKHFLKNNLRKNNKPASDDFIIPFEENHTAQKAY